MNRFLIIAVIIFSSCAYHVDNRLTDFNNKLGQKKATALDNLTESFETYLHGLYPETSDFQNGFCEFLEELKQNGFQLSEKLLLPDSLAIELVTEFDKSGLNEELMIPISDSLTPDNYFELNLEGAYHKELCEFTDDDFIAGYLKARESEGDMSLPILVDAFAYYCDNSTFSDPINKRICALEIFVKIAFLSIE